MTHEHNAPLRIAEIPTPIGGLIGITFAPGKKQEVALSGRHHRDLATDLDAIASWNAAAIVSLVGADELAALGIERIGEETQRRFMEWRHWPIADYDVPGAEFRKLWEARASGLLTQLGAGHRILVHCKGGLGRAGMIAARLLVEAGEPAEVAIGRVREARPGAIETAAQEAWARDCDRCVRLSRARGKSAHDRALGALLGLAAGDAVGTTLEFTHQPNFAVLTDMIGGGPFALEAGQWTDDTAMALALADSLLADPHLDPRDLMQRFVRWHRNGENSCTGTCFDIGNATRAALERFRATGEPLAGSSDPGRSGNGALMRLSPAAIRHWNNRPALVDVAVRQTKTTHGSPDTIEASMIFAEMLADAIVGQPLDEILSGTAAERIGSFKGAPRSAIRGSGYVAHSLQAAVWAVSRTTSFRSAILLAANLGEDADTTAAIAGQLAGAVYGASAIPGGWLDRLAWRERIEAVATELFEQSRRAAGDAPAALVARGKEGR